MPVRLKDALATTEPLADLFADHSVLQAMLDFEAALARAEARTGAIPQSAADAITAAARAENFDAAQLNPKDSAAAYNVALSLQRLRFFRDAANWFEEVLRRNLSHPDRRELCWPVVNNSILL